MKKKILKITALATVVFFSTTSLRAAPAPAVLNASELAPIKFQVPDKLTFPQDLGSLQEFSHSTESDRFVIYIQDAHAIVDAQKNMESLIQYFQHEFNIRFVAVEGAKDNLDPTIFKTFPDEFVKKKILNQYAAKGEISGPELSSIFSPFKSTYFGIEDWKIYQQNYNAYLQAVSLQGKVLERLENLRKSLDEKRASLYSPEFNQFHEKVSAFRDEKLDLFQFLKFLASLDKEGSRITEDRFPHLFPVFKASITEDPSQNENIDVTLRKMADHLKKKGEGKFSAQDAKEFNEKYQNFVTAQIDSGSFLKFLVDSGKKIGVSPKLSPKMRELLGQTETLSMIKGTKLFEELETLLNDFESNYAQTPEQKELSAQYHRLLIIKDLSNLEWTRAQLDEYQKDSSSYLTMMAEGSSDIYPALDFYRFAMERDRIFLDKIDNVMDKEKVQGVIVLTGGFHAVGFEERLKNKKYSYAVIMPKMNSLEGHENYAPVMKGDLSYKKFLKTTLYDAFVKDSTLKMVNELSEPDFRKNIKVWRDAIIRELASQGRIEKSGQYTKYVDELFNYYAGKYGLNGKFKTREEILKGVDDEVVKLNKDTLATFAEKFQMKTKQFFEGFKSLAGEGKLNISQIKDLYTKVATSQPSALAPGHVLNSDFTANMLSASPIQQVSTTVDFAAPSASVMERVADLGRNQTLDVSQIAQGLTAEATRISNELDRNTALLGADITNTSGAVAPAAQAVRAQLERRARVQFPTATYAQIQQGVTIAAENAAASRARSEVRATTTLIAESGSLEIASKEFLRNLKSLVQVEKALRTIVFDKKKPLQDEDVKAVIKQLGILKNFLNRFISDNERSNKDIDTLFGDGSQFTLSGFAEMAERGGIETLTSDAYMDVTNALVALTRMTDLNKLFPSQSGSSYNALWGVKNQFEGSSSSILEEYSKVISSLSERATTIPDATSVDDSAARKRKATPVDVDKTVVLDPVLSLLNAEAEAKAITDISQADRLDVLNGISATYTAILAINPSYKLALTVNKKKISLLEYLNQYKGDEAKLKALLDKILKPELIKMQAKKPAKTPRPAPKKTGAGDTVELERPAPPPPMPRTVVITPRTKVSGKKTAKNADQVLELLQTSLDGTLDPNVKTQIRYILATYKRVRDISPSSPIILKGGVKLLDRLNDILANKDSVNKKVSALRALDNGLEMLVNKLDEKVRKAARAIGDNNALGGFPAARRLVADPVGSALLKEDVLDEKALRARSLELSRVPAGSIKDSEGVKVEGMVFHPQELTDVTGQGFAKNHSSVNSLNKVQFATADSFYDYDSTGSANDIKLERDVKRLVQSAEAQVAAALKYNTEKEAADKAKISYKAKAPNPDAAYLTLEGKMSDMISSVLTQYNHLMEEVQDIYKNYGENGEGINPEDAVNFLKLNLLRAKRLRFAAETLRFHLDRLAPDSAKNSDKFKGLIERLTVVGIWTGYLIEMISHNLEQAQTDYNVYAEYETDAKSFGPTVGRKLAKVGSEFLADKDAEADEKQLILQTKKALTELDESTRFWIARGLAMGVTILSAIPLIYALIFSLSVGLSIIALVGTAVLSFALMMAWFEFSKGKSPFTFTNLLMFTLPIFARVTESAKQNFVSQIEPAKPGAIETTVQTLAKKEDMQKKVAREVLKQANSLLDSMNPEIMEAAKIFLAVAAAGSALILLPFFLGANLGVAIISIGALIAFVIGIALFTIGSRGTGIGLFPYLRYSITGAVSDSVISKTVIKNNVLLRPTVLAKQTESQLKRVVVIIADGVARVPKKGKDGLADPNAVKRILTDLQTKGVTSVETVSLTDLAVSRSELRSTVKMNAQPVTARSEVRSTNEDQAGTFSAVDPNLVGINRRLQTIFDQINALGKPNEVNAYGSMATEAIQALVKNLLTEIVTIRNAQDRGLTNYDDLLKQSIRALNTFFAGFSALDSRANDFAAKQQVLATSLYDFASSLALDPNINGERDALGLKALQGKNIFTTRLAQLAVDLFSKVKTVLSFQAFTGTLNDALDKMQERSGGYAQKIGKEYGITVRSELRAISAVQMAAFADTSISKVYNFNGYVGASGNIIPANTQKVRRDAAGNPIKPQTEIRNLDVVLQSLSDLGSMLRASYSGNVSGDLTNLPALQARLNGSVSQIVGDLIDRNNNLAINNDYDSQLKIADALYDLASKLLLNDDNALRDTEGRKAVKAGLNREIAATGLVLFQQAQRAYAYIPAKFLGQNNLSEIASKYLAKVQSQYNADGTAKKVSVVSTSALRTQVATPAQAVSAVSGVTATPVAPAATAAIDQDFTRFYNGWTRQLSASSPFAQGKVKKYSPVIDMRSGRPVIQGSSDPRSIFKISDGVNSVLSSVESFASQLGDPAVRGKASQYLIQITTDFVSRDSNIADNWPEQLKVADKLFQLGISILMDQGVVRSGLSADQIAAGKFLLQRAAGIYNLVLALGSTEASKLRDVSNLSSVRDAAFKNITALNAKYPAGGQSTAAVNRTAATAVSAAVQARSELRLAGSVKVLADTAGLNALAPIDVVTKQVLNQFSGDATLTQISSVFDAISAERREGIVKEAQEKLRVGISTYLGNVQGEGLSVATAILTPEFEAEIARLTQLFAEQVFADEQVRAAFAETLKGKFAEQLQRFVVNSVILGYELQQAQAAQDNIKVDAASNAKFILATQAELEERYGLLLDKVKAENKDSNAKLVIDGVEMPATLFTNATPDTTTSYVLDTTFAANREYLKSLLTAEHPVALAYPVGTQAEKEAMQFARELPGLMRMIFSTLGSRNEQPVDLNRLSKFNFAPESRQTLVGQRLAVKSAGTQGDLVVQTQESFVPVVGENDFLPMMVKFLSTNLVKQLPEVKKAGSRYVVLDEKHLSIFLNLVKRLMTEVQTAAATAKAA